MAVIYLRSTTGSDANDGSTWALAKATLAAALTAAGAGGTVYVSQVHAESQASVMTLTSPGTANAPVMVLCVNDAAGPPTTLATSATVSTTGNNTLTLGNGFAYIYGVSFIAGNSTGTANLSVTNSGNAAIGWTFEAGLLKLGGTGSASVIGFSSTTHNVYMFLINTKLEFGNAFQKLSAKGNMKWLNTASAIQGTVPNTLVTSGYPQPGTDLLVSGVDLSAMGSGKVLVDASGPFITASRYRFCNCKLGASVGVMSTAIPSVGGAIVTLENCDSADTNYRMEHYKYQGSIKAETAKIRSGGASDGTTPLSWNMSTLAVSSFVSPLDSPPVGLWIDATGSAKTLTLEIAQDGAATALNNDEIWLEVDYMGMSGYPTSSTASNRKTNIMASAAAQPASTVTWNNMTTPTRQSLAVTFTPQKSGYIQARVMLAKPSITVYVDPKITVS